MTEHLPKSFTLDFLPLPGERVQVLFNGKPIGDVLTDNAYETDHYRYHDIFHFSFATILNWSPCVRALLNCKRKSDPKIDEVEDGARARSMEEGLSAIIFEDASANDFYENVMIRDEKLATILSAVQRLEVGNKPLEDWKEALDKAYKAFRYLVKNNGGRIVFNADTKTIIPSNEVA